MSKMYLFSAALLFPAVLLADVSVSVRVGDGNRECGHVEEYAEAEYRDNGDPWFEECESSWPHRVSLEYQWTLHGPRHVLRYREVRFHLLSGAWFFGPWMIKVNYCHPSCTFHHHHVYYHHHSHPNWCRVYDHSARVYYYEYRTRHHRSNHVRVHRHEYRPAIRVTERVYETHSLPKRSGSADWDRKRDRKEDRHSNFVVRKEPEGRDYRMPKKAEKSVSRNSRNVSRNESDYQDRSRKDQNNRIMRISGRR